MAGNLFFEIADHLPNFVVIKDRQAVIEARHNTRIFSDKNIVRFRSILAQAKWDDVIDNSDTNICYDLFNTKYCAAFNEAFPVTRVSRKRAKDKKWMTSGLRTSIKHKNKLYRRLLRKPNEINKVVYKEYKNKLTTLIRKCEKDYYSQLLHDAKNDVRSIWRIYSQFMNGTNKKSSTIDSLKVNDKVINENKEKARAFNDYFASIGSKMARKFDTGNCYKSYLTEPNSNNLFLSPVTEQELLSEISKLPAKKSSGLDNISPKIVKATSDIIIEPLTHIYNCSFLNATVPDSLKIAKVIPIFKKGKRNLPENYRPISLLSTFNKILEKLVYKRLYGFLNNNNVLNDYQFGFRKGHSTILAVTEIVDNIRSEIDNS